jgi:hypothetical protein
MSMVDSTISNSAHVGLEVEKGAVLPLFERNTLTGNAAGPVKLGANAVASLGPGSYGGNGFPGIQVVQETVTPPAVEWRNLEVPYIAEAGFSLAAPLNLQSGVELRLGKGALLNVEKGGGLRLSGTKDLPVTITSSQTAVSATDCWRRIVIKAGSLNDENVFQYSTITSGGNKDQSTTHLGQLQVQNGAALTLDNVTFTHLPEIVCDVRQETGATITKAGINTYVPCP